MSFDFKEQYDCFNCALVLSLVLIGIALYRQKYSDITFPPVVAECPDYWKNVSTDNQIECENVKNSVLGVMIKTSPDKAFVKNRSG